jgi:Spy/CpxP family protein refolding chaperone
MARKEMIFLSTLALVLCAGLAAGRLWGRWAETEIEHSDHAKSKMMSNERTSWLADQLNLSADQRQKMDSIWSDTRQKMEKMGEARRGLAADRDKSIVALLNPQQRTAYDKVYDDFRNRREQVDKDRQNLIDDATQRSKLLLDDNQKKEWDVLTRRMRERRSATMPSATEPAGNNATTQPAGGSADVNAR